jgi:glycosyltransferase involved in cell wall biosynthesis
VPNGIDFSFIPRFIQLELAAKPFRLIYAGSHALQNDLQTILKAANLLEAQGYGERIQIELIGDGPDKPRLQALARELGLSMVSFSPPVPKHEIYAKLAAADAYIVTMLNLNLYKYGMSFNKMYDYLAMGRPILFAGAASNDPVAESKAGWTLPPQDPQALAEGIKKMLALSYEERVTMGLNGRRFAEDIYDLRKLAIRLEAALEYALASSDDTASIEM